MPHGSGPPSTLRLRPQWAKPPGCEGEALGVAQDAFSLKAGVDRSYYGRLERGERQPTVSLLLRIAGALGMSGAELLAEAEALLAKGKRPRK